MPDVVQTDMQIAWIQPDGPNTPTVVIPCAVINEVVENHGTIEATYCRNSQTGKHEIVTRMRSTPEPTVFDLEELMTVTATDIERVLRRDCPVPVYIGTYQCAPRISFSGFDRMKVAQGCKVETATEGSLMQREGHSLSTEMVSLSAASVEKAFRLSSLEAQIDGQILRDIARGGDAACYGDCGPNAAICETLVAVTNGTALLKADVLVSMDGGRSWETTILDPFAVNEDIASVVCFPINQTTWRWIVGRGTTDVAAPPEIAYTDNEGLTWVTVDLGSTNAGYILHGSAIFALDMHHIWIVDDQGDIWFSDDGAASFTEQVTTNAIALYGVYFMDTKKGVAVGGNGAANVMLITVNGGKDWVARSAIGPGATFVPWAVTMHDMHTIFIVGVTAGGAGQLWYTNDGGASWMQRILPMPTGMTSVPALFDIERIDRCCMFLAGEAQVGGVSYGVVYRTINGGTDWDSWTSEAMAGVGTGFQAVTVCSYNQGFAVGEE